MMLMLGHALDRLIPAMVCHTSMKVTSDPRAVYTSENSRPMYPEPMMAIQSGTHSSFSAWSLVNTCRCAHSQFLPEVLQRVFPGP